MFETCINATSYSAECSKWTGNYNNYKCNLCLIFIYFLLSLYWQLLICNQAIENNILSLVSVTKYFEVKPLWWKWSQVQGACSRQDRMVGWWMGGVWVTQYWHIFGIYVHSSQISFTSTNRWTLDLRLNEFKHQCSFCLDYNCVSIMVHWPCFLFSVNYCRYEATCSIKSSE